MLPTVYIDARTTKFYFCEFLAVSFLTQSNTFWDSLGKTDVMDVSLRMAVLEETCLDWGLDLASCFCLVRASKLTINQQTWPSPTIRLGSLLTWYLCGCTRGLLLKSLGLWVQLHCKLHFKVLRKNFCRCWSAPSDALACPWRSLGGLLTAAQNRLISYQKVLGQNSSACWRSCILEKLLSL